MKLATALIVCLPLVSFALGPQAGAQQSPGTAPRTTAPPPASGQSSTAKPTPTAPSSAATGNQFANEGQAKARCPSDTVVWANLSSKIYHFTGNKDYGHTKKGAYMCEKDATTAGFHAAKGEKHPA
jgi:hypothetical protein